MPRQKSSAWIYRWTRPMMVGLASIGAVVTAYLTYIKLTGNQAACPTDGCDIVLSSPYATIFGLPLALFGFLAYTSMVAFAIAPLLLKSAQSDVANSNLTPQSARSKPANNKLEALTGQLLFMGGTAMMIFSGYLMYLLVFEIKAACTYCIASAVLSTSLFLLALFGRRWEDIGGLLFTGVIVGMIALIGSLGIYAGVNNPAIAEQQETTQLTAQGYSITTSSSQAEISLANHLKQVGAVFYGSYTCPHCHEQKQLFGKEAAKNLPYIECNPQGANPRPDLCQTAGVQAYPTWIVRGKTVTGTQPLEQLANLSGYRGVRNFKNILNSTPE